MLIYVPAVTSKGKQEALSRLIYASQRVCVCVCVQDVVASGTI